jgi:hypothetical protein
MLNRPIRIELIGNCLVLRTVVTRACQVGKPSEHTLSAQGSYVRNATEPPNGYDVGRRAAARLISIAPTNRTRYQRTAARPRKKRKEELAAPPSSAVGDPPNFYEFHR